jgi:hypothetical protein
MSIVLLGSTSGSVTLQEPAVAGTTVFNLPATSGTVVVTGTTPSLNGIAFPATQSASADANTLDDYEEGTWTPIIGGTGGQSGQSYSGQEGHYTKVGRVVTVNFRVVLSAKGTITGSAVITGLPFTIVNTITYASGATIWDNLATNWTSVFPKPGAGSTYATIDGTKSAVSASIVATTSDIADNTQFNGSFTYFTS